MEKIIKEVPLPALLEQLTEECCELGHAASKFARKIRGENPTPVSEERLIHDLTEEVADVLLCIDILERYDLINVPAVERVIKNKKMRWHGRLDEEV